VTSPEWGAGTPHGGPPQYEPPPYGPPYGGPPQQQWRPPQQWGPPQPWGPPPYPPPGSPQPGWGATPYPPRPQRPGSVIAAAVLAFASAVLVLVGTVYAMAFSALLSLARGPDAGMGAWFALLQLALAGLLVVGGLRALSRDLRWLRGATAVQLALSVYWLVVLDDIAPPTVGAGVLVLPLLYGALAAVAAGLTFLPDARARTARPSGPPPAGG
jgi:hypothetical protein